MLGDKVTGSWLCALASSPFALQNMPEVKEAVEVAMGSVAPPLNPT